MRSAKVQDNPDLIRDLETKAILATNKDKFNEHREKREFFKKLMSQGEELNELKHDIAEIKSLLNKLLLDK